MRKMETSSLYSELPNLSAVILAGGKSSRMGCDKSQLLFGDKTLLEIQIMKMLSIGISDIVVSGQFIDFERVRCVSDIIPDKGPLSGIHASMIAAKNEYMLVMSVDVPLIPREWLILLIEEFEKSKPEVLLMMHEGRVEPLIGIYKTSLAFEIEMVLQEKRTSVFNFLDRVGYSTFSYTGNQDYLLNCNSPEDYEKLLTLAGNSIAFE